ncbi:uncharacterized protein LOC143300336 [Babylonia areolata]|uniref:uncharacterized protein LOC143300336 n=1 Tax=Babylonia areolata TaxID=304850 RepID=UPI003FD18AA2
MESENTTSPISATVNDTDLLLQRLSDERALQLLPVFVIFGVIFVLGVLGNCLTVYVYWNKFKATWSRTAIVTLGILDLVSCLVAIPGEAIDLRYSFNYESDVMCRLSRACATFPNVASGIMLTAVAFDRYRLICLPLKSSASRRQAWKSVVTVCAISFMVSWPAAIIYGTMTTETGMGQVTASECSTSDLVKETKFPLAYKLVLAAVFLFAFGAMIVCYFFIGRQIYRQGEFRKTLLNLRDGGKRRNTHSDLETSMVSDADGRGDLSQDHNSSENHHPALAPAPHSSDDKSKGDESTEMREKKLRESHSPCNHHPSSSPSPSHSHPTSPSFSPRSSHHHHHHHHPNRSLSRSPSVLQRIRKRSSVDSRTRKTTLMLCFISIVFVLSFLPHLAVKLVKVMDKDFLRGAGTGRLIVYNLSARSYFLNSFLNVFIYGFCSFRFRKEAKKNGPKRTDNHLRTTRRTLPRGVQLREFSKALETGNWTF